MATKEAIPLDKTNMIHKKINRTPVNTQSIESMTRETDKMVTGQFINIECPEQPAKISVKLYPGMEYFSRLFLDQERCTIPLSVARFINERCAHEKHVHLQDEKGNPVKDGKSHPRYRFMIESMAA